MAKQLITSGLRFEGRVKKVEKFWKAGLGSVCLKCYKISHKHLEKYKSRSKKCVIYARKVLGQ